MLRVTRRTALSAKRVLPSAKLACFGWWTRTRPERAVGAIPSQHDALRAQGIRPHPLVYPDSDTSNHSARSRRADNHYYVDALTFCSTMTAVGTRPSASSVASLSR